MMNGVGKHFSELADMALAGAKQIQKTPIGTRERSPQEEAALCKKMRAVPQPEFDNMMNVLASEVGHQDGEEQLCSLCKFVGKHAQREAK